MKTLMTLVAALVPCVLPIASWAADEGLAGGRDVQFPAPAPVAERLVTVPPVTCDRQVPVYETVTVPVMERRCVPQYEDREVPVFATREVPVYRTECVPVWGEKEVTVYRKEKQPLKIELWNPFGCKDTEIELWDRCVDVPCGTETRRAVVGQEQRQVQCGTRLVSYQSGTRLERVQVGTKVESIQVGTREERRLVGYETQKVVVEPARTQIVSGSVSAR